MQSVIISDVMNSYYEAYSFFSLVVSQTAQINSSSNFGDVKIKCQENIFMFSIGPHIYNSMIINQSII